MTDLKIEKLICGIVMPIASMGETYPEDHWRRVRRILQTAIERAGLTPKVVWDNPEIDVIQSAILQNLYENDVVICDVSGLNPNVMLETGLRLSTKRPTIIVTDKVVKPPFDISNIGYIDYQKDLEYNATEKFISELSNKIMSVASAYSDGTYKPFVSQFKFETVEPETISVSTDQYLMERLDQLSQMVKRIDARQRPPRGRDLEPRIRPVVLKATLSDEAANKAEAEIDDLSGFEVCSVTNNGDGTHTFVVPISNISRYSRAESVTIIQRLLDKIAEDDLPF